MTCSECKCVLSTEELNKKIKCDQCKALLCQGCSGLSGTEIRVLQLCKRSLIFYCNDCNIPNIINQMVESFSNKLAEIEETFMASLSTIKSDLEKGISQTREEVVMVKESNIELIHLLSNTSTGHAPSADASVKVTTTIKPPAADIRNSNFSQVHVSNSTSKLSYAESAKKIPSSKVSGPKSDSHLRRGIGSNNPQKSKFSRKPISHHDSNTEINSGIIASQFVRKKQRKMNVGSGNGDGKFHGKTGIKKIWLFVTRVPDVVNAEDIKNYILTRTKIGDSSNLDPPERNIDVKVLDTDNSKSNNRSFMVGVEPELKDEVYKESFWPMKIAFQRFDFRRGQRFLGNVQEDQTAVSKQPESFLG